VKLLAWRRVKTWWWFKTNAAAKIEVVEEHTSCPSYYINHHQSIS
jgi:hypothetical protein